jgi:CDP-glycerol glycerophosphotransferase (TagB/SpsB family)
MPTWRAELTGKWDLRGQRRDYNPNFAASRFAGVWRSLLRSPELAELCRTYGYETIFRPHPGFEDYLADFELPAHIRASAGESIQDLLKSSALLVTDYSSVAFDMAFMLRPSIYYHFEDDAGFAAGQNRRPGYFSYARDGFGPVCRTEKEVLERLRDLLPADCRPAGEYRERMERAFDTRDGRCCERTFEAVLNLRRHRDHGALP